VSKGLNITTKNGGDSESKGTSKTPKRNCEKVNEKIATNSAE